MARVQVMQIVLHAPYAAVYAHIVVIQYDEQVVGCLTCIVDSFIGQSSAHAAISDYSHHMSVLMSCLLVGNSHSQSCRDAVGGMTTGERVIFAFFG